MLICKSENVGKALKLICIKSHKKLAMVSEALRVSYPNLACYVGEKSQRLNLTSMIEISTLNISLKTYILPSISDMDFKSI